MISYTSLKINETLFLQVGETRKRKKHVNDIEQGKLVFYYSNNVAKTC